MRWARVWWRRRCCRSELWWIWWWSIRWRCRRRWNRGMQAQERLLGTADTQNLAASEPVAERRDSSPPSSELVNWDGIRGLEMKLNEESIWEMVGPWRTCTTDAGDANQMTEILQEITAMQVTAEDRGTTHENSECEKTRIGQHGAEAPNVIVKQEKDGGGTGQSRVVDINGECARQLQTDLDEQYMIEEATHLANRQLSLIAQGVVVYVVDSDSNEDAEFEEWSDHEHECLVEIDRRLREQEDKDAAVAKKCQEEAEREAKEQQAKDEELARKCEQEMKQKAREQVVNDNHVASSVPKAV